MGAARPSAPQSSGLVPPPHPKTARSTSTPTLVAVVHGSLGLFTRPGLICTGASTPFSMCPDISVCSSFALSIVRGGACFHQHISFGEGLWYTTCALLALLAPNQRFALHLFLFAAVSFTYPLFLHSGGLTLLLPESTSLDPHRVNLCSLLALPRRLCTMSVFVLLLSSSTVTSSTAWLMIPMRQAFIAGGQGWA